MAFWDEPDVVQQFAAREPDRRLIPLLDSYAQPASTRVLDLGCAGGRNTVPLAGRGFDVHALDASPAMVEETRRRVAEVLGEDAARERVRQGRMDDLSSWPDGRFDLVVALGILHQAESWTEWGRAMDEVARVLKWGGRLLIAHFSPDTAPTGVAPTRVAGEAHVFDGLHGGRATLLTVEELDAQAAARGLLPEEPTSIGETRTETGRRVSVNGLYRKQ